MQPVNSPRSSFLRRITNQFAPYSLMLMVQVDGGIKQEAMNAPVPGYFYKANQPFGVLEKGANIKQAALEREFKVCLGMPEPSTPEKRVEVVVKHSRVNFIGDGFQKFYPPIYQGSFRFQSLKLPFQRSTEGNHKGLPLQTCGVRVAIVVARLSSLS